MFYQARSPYIALIWLLAAVFIAAATPRADADLAIQGGSQAQQQLLRQIFTSRIPAPLRQGATLFVNILTDRQMNAYIHYGNSAHMSSNDAADAIDGIFEDGPPTITLRGATDQCALPFTFVHEFGHFFWQNGLTKTDRSRYGEVYSKQKRAHSLITEYAATDVHEGFAEAFSYYILSKTTLRHRDPLSCAYLDNVFGRVGNASQPVVRVSQHVSSKLYASPGG
ncbi:MAG: hypothetical protein P4L33_13810 [Capsulimonadaceae bacterium]|nr:hypothetical protein [Capsulimonadaceae bacterium]